MVLTDFSAQAKHAAEYAYSISKKINAKMILCNAIIIPAAMPQAGLVIWPMEESGVLEENSTDQLEKLKAHLEKMDQSHDKKPQIGIINQPGYLQDVVKTIVGDLFVDVVVMGTHENKFGSFLFGSQTQNMINSITVPLLLVPSNTKITPFESIYFASDLSDPQGDSAFLKRLIPLAMAFKAEIFITHISTPQNTDRDLPEKTKEMMLEFSSDLGYPGMHFIRINEEQVISGLDNLMAKESKSLLVMVHREKSFLDGLLKGSRTQKLAKDLEFPMLIFKAQPQAEHIA